MNSRYVIMMLVLILFFVTDAAATQRTALVIGNSSYQSSPLKNPVNDATDMAATLTRSGFAVSLKINADQRTMVTAIREFGRQIKQDGGVGLFYYAGHGIQVRGRNYLIPLEAVIESEGDVQFEAVDAAFVLSKMEDAGNDMNIVILDACRNNPFARSFRSGNQGLARMDAPKGSIIAYATAPGELAADGTGRNGIYTKHLIQNIQTPQIRLEDVFKNVRRAVVNETGNKQVPWESSSLMGQFYFTQAQPQPSPAITKQNTAIDSSYEILFWESIKDSRDVQAYNAYLNQFPNGVFVELANLKIKNYTHESDKETLAQADKNDFKKSSAQSPLEIQEKKFHLSKEDQSKEENEYMLAIFPFALSTHPIDHTLVQTTFHEISSVLSEYSTHYILQYTHYDDIAPKKPIYNQDSAKIKEILVQLNKKDMWKRRNFFSFPQPNEEKVKKLSYDINANLIFMLFLNIDNRTDYIHFYLIDLKNDKLFIEKSTTEVFTNEGAEKIKKMSKKIFHNFFSGGQ
jgi:hypothetical protein